MARKVCEYVASIRLEGAPAAMQERTFKTQDAADRWLSQQRDIADRRGWGGYRFERREICSVKKRR